MNSLDQWISYIVAGVFLYIGVTKIMSYRRRPRSLGAHSARLPFGLPRGWIVAVGVFEVAAALALVTPFGLLPQLTSAQLAAAGLAVLTGTAVIYHMRRQETAIPSLTLFCLVLLVVVGRWM